MKLFPFFPALLFATFAEIGWSSDGPTESQREESREKVDFGPSYFIIESTYLVRSGSEITNLIDVDRPNVRVIGIANTATIRAIAVPKNRPNALAYATAFMEEAKASGMVRRAFADAGLKDLMVAPPSVQ
jgi:hypothetical protein